MVMDAHARAALGLPRRRAMKTLLTTLAMTALLSLGPGTSSAAAADTPDAWITAKTRIALMTTEGIDSWDLDVDTNVGVVTLHGKVETAAAKAAAERETRRLDGVKEVKNLLQVVSRPAREATNDADEVIEDRVEDALDGTAALKNSGIRVASVNKGVVLLTGTTDTVDLHLKAIETAHAVKGVRRVSSDVRVKYDKAPGKS
jgi:osmotically-inducible protein OsmY